jgi:polyphosphate glucokinase
VAVEKKRNRKPKVLVIDVGGSNVKFTVWNGYSKRKFPSGKNLTPKKMTEQVLAMIKDEEFDAVTIGIPGPVIHGRPAMEPRNLGKGWMRFDFQKHFGKPVKIINDAAMQALGSYRGGRMLFIGLGTGVGSTLILDDVIVPLELGELSYSKKHTIAQVLSDSALEKYGVKHWETAVHRVVRRLATAFRADYLVIGGGNAKLLKRVLPEARRGSNNRAFVGGARLWRTGTVYARARKHTWVIT